MSQQWNLKALRDHIRERAKREGWAESKAWELTTAVNSVYYSGLLHAYHVRKALRALDDKLPERAALSYADMLSLSFGGGERAQALSDAKLISWAHTISALHTVRNAVDIFAQLVNGLSPHPPCDFEKCDFPKLQRKASALDPAMANLLNGLADNDSYRYINAFINVTKHRHLVPHGLEFSDTIGMKFAAFTYRKTKHEGKRVDSILELSTAFLKQIIESGIVLNAHLGLPDATSAASDS